MHWTYGPTCIEITRTKTMKIHRLPFPGKVQGTSFVDHITVLNSLPIHDTRWVWCTRKYASDKETKTTKQKTYSDSSNAIFLFCCLNSSLANWMSTEKCSPPYNPETPQPPHPTAPIKAWQTDLYTRTGKKRPVALNGDCISNPNCAFPSK